MSADRPPEIYFHVGLSKNASTYLQYRVFPKFSGIIYLQRSKHRKYADIITRAGSGRFLLSREYDRQLEAEVARFAAWFPDTHPIIVLRRHGSWLASQYRRWVKNGYAGTFEDFIHPDTGIWKPHEVLFYPKLESLSKNFTQPALVLIYDDLLQDAEAFIQTIASYCGAEVDMTTINRNPKHRSYNEKQLLWMRRWSRKVPIVEPATRTGWKKALYRWLRMFQIYPRLYLALLLPPPKGEGPLIDSNLLLALDERYQDDWARCNDYVNQMKGS